MAALAVVIWFYVAVHYWAYWSYEHPNSLIAALWHLASGA